MDDTTRDAVLQALSGQLDELARMVAGLDEKQWSLPSGCAGWSIADVLLHLAQTNEMATASAHGRLREAGRGAEWAGAGTDVDVAAAAAVAAEREASSGEIHSRWTKSATDMLRAFAEVDPATRVQWVVGDMAARSLATTRIAETWIHTGDIADGLGVPHPPTDRLQHIVFLVHRTLPYAFTRAGLEPPPPVAFELTPPSGGQPWIFGDPHSAATVVRGPALDLCLMAGQRAVAADTDVTARGPDAHAVLTLMRTFA